MTNNGAPSLLGRDLVDLMRDAPGYDGTNLVAITLPPALACRGGTQVIVEGAADDVGRSRA